jgi:opacity protein-like surface antigen
MQLRFLTLLVALLAAAGCHSAHAQTDVAVSAEGAFTNSTVPGNSNFFRINPAASVGGLLELRHIARPWLGLEASYQFHRANEVYDELVVNPGPVPVSCTSNCPIPTYTVRANAQQFSAAWVPSIRIASFRPFAIVGVGLLVNQPTSGQSGTTTITQGTIVYGAGLDWNLTRHLGLRLQYRGNHFQAPGIVPPNNTNPSIGNMHTTTPGIGVFYKF